MVQKRNSVVVRFKGADDRAHNGLKHMVWRFTFFDKVYLTDYARRVLAGLVQRGLLL